MGKCLDTIIVVLICSFCWLYLTLSSPVMPNGYILKRSGPYLSHPPFLVFTAQAYARAVLGVVILFVRPSVRLSVTRVHCDKTKWCTSDIFIPHERAITLLLDTKSGWWAMLPSLWNLRSKWPTPFEKRRFRPISAHNVSTVGDSEKSSITTNMKSTTDFPFQRAIDGVCTLRLSALKGGSKSNFSLFWVKVNR